MAVRVHGALRRCSWIAFLALTALAGHAQTPPFAQSAPGPLVRIMAVWGEDPIRPETPLRPSNALLVSSSTQGAMLLTNASSIRGARSILVMENVLLPEQATMRATLVSADETLDLAVLAAPPLSARPVATLNVAPLATGQRYSVLAFLHRKGVPLEPTPGLSGPVVQAANQSAPAGPPLIDLSHGNVGAEGALVDDCGFIVGWHVPPYAFPNAQITNGIGISAARIVAWLTQAGFNAQTTSGCVGPAAAPPPALLPVAPGTLPSTAAVTPDPANPAASVSEPALAEPESPAQLADVPARSKTPIIIAAGAGFGIALLVAGMLYFRKDANMAPPKRPRVSNLLQRASDTAPPVPVPAMSWRFQGKMSNGKRLRFTLKASDVVKRSDGLLIGRDRKSTKLHIEDESLSRIHAKLFYVNGDLRIEDCGSENGTTINGRRLTAHRPETIRAGDSVGLGGVQLRIG
ncbi:MAG: FHA domain-containing protein [Gammaproteobacteria bacterium]